MQTFPKKERLCGKNLISNLFDKGSSIKNSIFTLVWNYEEYDEEIIAKTLIVIPKKHIKNATNRNLLKRRIREAFCIYKSDLYEKLKSNNHQISIAIIYQKEKLLPYYVIDSKINLILTRLSEKV